MIYPMLMSVDSFRDFEYPKQEQSCMTDRLLTRMGRRRLVPWFWESKIAPKGYSWLRAYEKGSASTRFMTSKIHNRNNRLCFKPRFRVCICVGSFCDVWNPKLHRTVMINPLIMSTGLPSCLRKWGMLCIRHNVGSGVGNTFYPRSRSNNNKVIYAKYSYWFVREVKVSADPWYRA